MCQWIVPSSPVCSRCVNRAICQLPQLGVCLTKEVLLQLLKVIVMLRHLWSWLRGNVVFATAFPLPLGALRLRGVPASVCRFMLQVSKGKPMFLLCYMLHD
jgi:hypothetical protein